MSKNILVTGSTGYVGGRLVPQLLEKGYNIRVLVRNPERLKNRSWHSKVEIFKGDVLKLDTLAELFKNIDLAYYLIHGMSDDNNFETTDVKAARNFCLAAKNYSVEKIIYLGGLAESNDKLSKHLSSRHKTGEVLRESGIDITEFRAGVIVGSGSLSFEMIRNLTERIPIMICPRWIYTKTQPIAISNIMEYLINTISLDIPKNQIFEIGGQDILSYGEMIKEYSKVRKLNRYLIPVPVLTPTLSSYWVHWTTPLSANITRPLVQSLKNESIVKNKSVDRYFSNIKLISYKQAVNIALEKLNKELVETSWSDSLSSSEGKDLIVDIKSIEGLIVEKRSRIIKNSKKNIFSYLLSLGGENGWLYANILWVIRGYIDLLVGGVGLRRGRRNPAELKQGDALDFWRVEKLILNKLIRLKAEMKLPGSAWLQYEIISINNEKSELIQSAYFAPRGLGGLAYWYLLYPIHKIIFSGLIKTIGERVENNENQ